MSFHIQEIHRFAGAHPRVLLPWIFLLSYDSHIISHTNQNSWKYSPYRCNSFEEYKNLFSYFRYGRQPHVLFSVHRSSIDIWLADPIEWPHTLYLDLEGIRWADCDLYAVAECLICESPQLPSLLKLLDCLFWTRMIQLNKELSWKTLLFVDCPFLVDIFSRLPRVAQTGPHNPEISNGINRKSPHFPRVLRDAQTATSVRTFRIRLKADCESCLRA